MQVALLVILGSLGTKVIDVLKFLRAKDWNAVVTQFSAWAAGAVIMFVASAAAVLHDVMIPTLNVTFGDLDGGSKVLVGTAIMSLLSKAYDLQRAFDNTDSAKTPKLTNLPSAPPQQN